MAEAPGRVVSGQTGRVIDGLSEWLRRLVDGRCARFGDDISVPTYGACANLATLPIGPTAKPAVFDAKATEL